MVGRVSAARVPSKHCEHEPAGPRRVCLHGGLPVQRSCSGHTERSAQLGARYWSERMPTAFTARGKLGKAMLDLLHGLRRARVPTQDAPGHHSAAT